MNRLIFELSYINNKNILFIYDCLSYEFDKHIIVQLHSPICICNLYIL